MQNFAATQRTADASSVSARSFPFELAPALLFVAALWFVLCRELSGEWSVNEQYNFGWFVPFFGLYLFWLRWQDQPQPEVRSNKSEGRNRRLVMLAMGIVALFLLLPIRLFEIANPEWRLLAWLHALAVVTLTLVIIWYVGGRPWVRHFAFPVAFIFIAVPWPTPVETPIIQGLMRIVAHVAAETAMLLGLPAQVEGNLIRVSTGLVGVNEACSGIRSLQTSLMIGLLFGELKRLSALRRIALVLGAVAIAVVANFVRAVFLVGVAATKNISEVSRWHDIAGYTIIALVCVGTMGLAYWLGKSEIGIPKSEIRIKRSQLEIGNRKLEIGVALCWLLLIEFGTAAWYRSHENNLVAGTRWSVQWPEDARNFQKLKINEEIRSVLRFDRGEGATWTMTQTPRSARAAIDGQNMICCLLYIFRWEAGRNSALLANLHRPDVCLPASGWTQVADNGVRSYPVNDSFELPFRHFEFQRAFGDVAPQIAHAFYSLSEDRASNASSESNTSLPSMSGNRSEWTRTERLRTVVEGRRHLGQQVIEAIFISSEALSATDAEAYLRDVIRNVVIPRQQTAR